MGNNPDWVFYHHEGPTESEVMPRLIAEFPDLRDQWEKHLESWEGKSPGSYIDIGLFVRFVVQDLYPSGKTEVVQRAFDLMEDWLKNGHVSVQQLVVIGFLEDLQNLASQQPLFRSSDPNRVRHGMTWRDFGRARALPNARTIHSLTINRDFTHQP